MEMRIGRQREVDRKGREREHKQENEKRLKNIQRFFFFWYLALRRSQQVTQARTEKSKESQRPVCHRVTASHVSLRSLSFTGAGITLMPHVARYCPRLYEVKRRWERERERLLWCRVPQPSSPNSFTTAQIPASSHKPPLCMGVFEIVNPYVLKWTWHKACCWSFITCVCVCMRRIQGHNIQARCISQTSRDVIL